MILHVFTLSLKRSRRWGNQIFGSWFTKLTNFADEILLPFLR